MKIVIRDFDHQIYKIAATDVIGTYIRVAFWISLFAFWKIYELLKPVYEAFKAKGWIG